MVVPVMVFVSGHVGYGLKIHNKQLEEVIVGISKTIDTDVASVLDCQEDEIFPRYFRGVSRRQLEVSVIVQPTTDMVKDKPLVETKLVESIRRTIARSFNHCDNRPNFLLTVSVLPGTTYQNM